MPGRKSSRSKKPVSYADSDSFDSTQPHVADKSGDKGDHCNSSNADPDPDFIPEVSLLDEEGGSDSAQVEANTDSVPKTPTLETDKENHPPKTDKENHPPKKRKTIQDFMSPVSSSSSQISRLDELQKTMTERGRNSLNNQYDQSEESFVNIMTGLQSVRAKGTPLRSPSTVTPSKSKGRGKNKIDGNTVEQWRRLLGNKCKASISFEKWTIAARTHFTIDFTLGAFRALIVPNASEVHPADFNESTPVVVASTDSTSQAATIFGSSKIRGGSRYGTFDAEEAEFVFVASTKKLSVWWTMS